MLTRAGSLYFAFANLPYNNSQWDLVRPFLKTVKGTEIPNVSNYGVANGGSESLRADWSNWGSHLKMDKSSLIYDTSYVTSYYGSSGVCFGNGTEPESLDSYTMSGDLFTTYTSSSSKYVELIDGNLISTIQYTLTNTGTEDFTISEVGLFGYYYQKHKTDSKYYRYDTLIERTLLESPITIPGNGGVGQVTYKISVPVPTA